MVCPSALDSKPLSCRDDFFATALKDLVGWFGNHKSYPPSKEGKAVPVNRKNLPASDDFQRVRPPKNVEVPKCSSTDTQTKTKVGRPLQCGFCIYNPQRPSSLHQPSVSNHPPFWIPVSQPERRRNHAAFT